jgi:hypothetical protein
VAGEKVKRKGCGGCMVIALDGVTRPAMRHGSDLASQAAVEASADEEVVLLRSERDDGKPELAEQNGAFKDAGRTDCRERLLLL